MARVGYPVKPRRRRSCCEPPTSFGTVHCRAAGAARPTRVEPESIRASLASSSRESRYAPPRPLTVAPVELARRVA